jgi:hypothetical protein
MYTTTAPCGESTQGEGMETAEFLSKMLPAAGLVCAAEIGPDKKVRQTFGESREITAQVLRTIDRRGANAYHGCATYLTKGSRKADNVAAVRSFWLDIDAGPGKPYPDARAAVEALGAFCRDVGLPLPDVVRSGAHGVHAYWPTDTDMEPAEWLPLATALKRLTAEWGLKADPSRTADLASILRPPGTHNRKRDAVPVRWVRKGPVVPLGRFRTAMERQGVAAPAKTRQRAPVDINHDLTGGQEFPPSSAEKIATECGVIRLMRDTRGDVDQPTWYGGLGVVAFTVEGEQKCHEWSDGHADYTPGETDRKIAQALRFAPTTCKKLSEAQPALCGACPHFGKITSPIVLGFEIAPQTKVTTVTSENADEVRLPLDVAAFSVTNGFHAPYKRRPIADGVAYRGELTLWIGAGGAGKSTIITLICAEVADHGFPGCEFDHPELPVVLVNAEDPRAELMLRAQALYSHYRRAARPDVYVVGSDNLKGLVLTELDPRGRERVSQQGMEQVRQWLRATKAKLLILDPLSAIAPYGLNDNGVAGAVMRELKAIAQEFDAGIVLVGHVRKGSTAFGDTAEAALGAAAWANLARAVWLVKRPDHATLADIGAQFDEMRHIREVVSVKANLSTGDDRRFYKIRGVPMGNATAEYPREDWVGVAEIFTPRPAGSQFTPQVLETVLRVLAQGAQGGLCHYSNAPQARGRYFVPDVVVGLAAHYPGALPSQLEVVAKAVLTECLAKGWVSVRDVPVPKVGSRSSNINKGIEVNWSRSPFSAQPSPGPFAK